MATALWNRVVLAQCGDFKVVDGNVYFPPTSICRNYIQPSEHHMTCPWKGLASYYDVIVDGKSNPLATWLYHTRTAAAHYFFRLGLRGFANPDIERVSWPGCDRVCCLNAETSAAL